MFTTECFHAKKLSIHLSTQLVLKIKLGYADFIIVEKSKNKDFIE